MKIDVLAQQKIDYWKRILQSEVTVFETLSSRLLADFGIPMVQGLLVSSAEQLQSASAEIGFPLVLKTAEVGIEHKTEVGGVMLNITSEGQLQEAYLDFSLRWELKLWLRLWSRPVA